MAAVIVGLAAGMVVVLVRDDGGDVATSDTASSTPGASTTTGPSGSATASAGEPDEVECSSEVLLAVAAEFAAAEATVADFGCELTSGYAWARLEGPGVDPLVVFYATDLGESPQWQPIAWGSDVVCDDALPTEACDQLPGAP